MKYQITITVDDETFYTHEWENYSDNIVFGHTPRLAAASADEFLTVGEVMQVVGGTIDQYRHYNAEDLPSASSTEVGDLPDYVEDRIVQEMMEKIFDVIEQDALFADVEAPA